MTKWTVLVKYKTKLSKLYKHPMTYHVIPFLKRCTKSESSWSLSVGLIMAIKYASIIFGLNLLVGALQIIDQVKMWSESLLMCCDGFDLYGGVLFFPSCFYTANSFPDVCFSSNTSSFLNFTSWMDTRIFNYKKSFHFSSEPFYSDVIFIISKFVKLFDKLLRSNFSFLSQYRISIKDGKCMT